MRNAVLSVMGDLLVQQLSESTDDVVKKTRDQYLDLLEVLIHYVCMSNTILYIVQEHLHDTNAFVRSKVLQVWRQLCEAKVMEHHKYRQYTY